MRSLLRSLVLLAALAAYTTPALAQLPSINSAKKKAEEALKKAKADSVKKAQADSTAKADSAAKAKPAGSTAPATAESGTPAKADPKVWDNYDFVPGSKVIFYTDFSEDKVGNFAQGLKYIGGQMDVVERDGVKMLRATSVSQFYIPVGKKLPERFTLEIDVISPPTNTGGYDQFAFEGGVDRDRGPKSAEINWQTTGNVIIGGGQDVSKSQTSIPEAMQPLLRGQVSHIRVLMDGNYFKMYTNERRIYNIPELQFRRDSAIRVFIKGYEEDKYTPFITGIRVAESETDVLYDALTAKGRWATQGILFATGKADLQPESTPVLKEIAGTLTKYPDLKILIEGHTDNVGAPASNLALSDARAAAVKTALATQYGIDGARITTKGFGDTKPAVPNTTSAGKAQNRRVEIVKQ